ncbi:MAG: transcriptional repressor [Clostridiales bacterium]|nr:transcriptional repressor [Clostridiales bacterium]
MLKKTKTREKVMHLLEVTSTPISANEIYEVLSNDGITLSSIYRTLDCFCKNELVIKETNPQGVAIYTLKQEEHSHILECKECHNKTKLDYCPYHKANENIKNKHNFFADEENIVIYGTCKDCMKNKKS